MARIAGYVLMATGFLACPCHLVFTLPLLAAALGGTALGVALLENSSLVLGLATAYFVVGLGLGLRMLSRRGLAPKGSSRSVGYTD